MDKASKRDFNAVAKGFLGLSMFAIVMSIITTYMKITDYRLLGIDYNSLRIEIIIDFLILIAIVLTFSKKPYGLIALTILFIIRIFATINWASNLTIPYQLGGKVVFFVRDFGLFAIAMCFRKNGISGWKSMLFSDNSEVKPKNMNEKVIEIVDEKEQDVSTTSSNGIDNNMHEIVESGPNVTHKKYNYNENLSKTDGIIDEEPMEKRRKTFSFPPFKSLSKSIKISLLFCLGVIVLFLITAAVVNLKSYPKYICSFVDRWKYTFNLPNNQLGKSLFERVFSLRNNSLFLIVTPGYENQVYDSNKFYKIRVDQFREYPSSSFYFATTPVNSNIDIVSNQYYIIKSKTGEPYACKGSELIFDGDKSRIIYQTEEYNYKNSLDEELSLVDEAAQVPVSDIGIIREIGGYYEHEGVYSKAADYYRFVLEHNENNSEIRGMLAYVLALNGESETAREEAEKTIEIAPKEKRALSALAIIEADEFNWKEAKIYSKKAIDYGADDSNVFYVFCEALYKQGEIKAAQYYYNRAYELYRGNPRRERYREYAGCPFEVLGFHYCSETYDGKKIIPYDEKLFRSKCFFINFKVDVNILRVENVRIGVKLFTNGRLETGQGSKDGYTFYEDINAKDLGKNFYYFSGWGSDTGNSWSVGNHDIELWYKGNKIAEDSFYVY